MNTQDFIDMLIPAALEIAKRDKIPASFTIAQAALESAWGGSKLAVEANNLFGIKADASWDGLFVVMPTREVIDGKEIKVDAKWRRYTSMQECLDDHSKFLKTQPRYAPAFIHECKGDQFAHYIAAGGYATDPLYASKLNQIIYGNGLLVLDEAVIE
jgi:flagellum-specific peptidoglycan hydrolase FlgJ